MSKPLFRLFNVAAFTLLLLALYLNFIHTDVDAYAETTHRASPQTEIAVNVQADVANRSSAN